MSDTRAEAVQRVVDSERAAVTAVLAALPILSADRDSLVESHTLIVNGKPDLRTLKDEVRSAVAEYDNAIRLCEVALEKAGLR